MGTKEAEEEEEEEGKSRCDAWRLLGNAPLLSGAREAVPADRRAAAAGGSGPLMRSSTP